MIVVGCNYHIKWQKDRAMRFVLKEVQGCKARMITRVSKKDFWCDISDLIFIPTKHNKDKAKEIQNKAAIEERDEPPTIGLVSDASYSKKHGYLEYQVMDLQTGEIVYNNGFKNLTSEYVANIGEFFGIVRAIKYVQDNEMIVPIYSDSLNAIRWVANKHCTGHVDNDLEPILAAANQYLKGIEELPPIFWWNKREWGENPVDFGRK